MESLPVELLRRIASYTPYPTIHALSFTSHRLRAAVHDWQVYKSIVDNKVHLFTLEPESQILSEPSVKEKIEQRSWTKNPITPSVAANTAAKYAYADYRAYRMPAIISPWEPLYQGDGSEGDADPLRDFAKWGGVLAARGHPLIHGLLSDHQSLKLIERSEETSSLISPTHRYMLTFCTTAYLLSDTARYPPPSNSEPTDAFTSFLNTAVPHLDSRWKEVLLELSALNQSQFIMMPDGQVRTTSGQTYRDTQYEGDEVPRTKEDIDRLGTSINQKDTTNASVCSAFALLELCVRTVGVLGWIYRRLILDGPIPGFRVLRWEFGDEITEEQANEVKRRYDSRQLWGPPVASGIPFEKYMRLEEELGGDGAGFVWSHLEGMVNKGFLEDGKWMGFYTYDGMEHIDPAMIDIVFTVVNPKDVEPPPQREYEDSSDDNSDEEDDGQGGSVKGEAGELLEKEEKKLKETQEEPAKTPDVPVIAVKATARDNVGQFILWGKFYPRTGKVHLTKAYYKGDESGTMWNWTAFMTPFGIVGRWGERGYGGYIWLWKEDWYGNVEGNELANRLRHERQA
ncbi:hypothetical protein TWF730_001554 [Orbilia blumenaviensis]|uniref:F-box domain-containing protein n=1 Tax=Orbilia blumenaviensis TaxID=1796055 RepID=A0AAV9UK36_9PEZI